MLYTTSLFFIRFMSYFILRARRFLYNSEIYTIMGARRWHICTLTQLQHKLRILRWMTPEWGITDLGDNDG